MRALEGTEYVELRELGKGGMGVTYLARHAEIDRLCAVKVMRPDRQSPAMADRFRREARALGKIRHPNVVSVHDFRVLADGQRLLVMEYVEGNTLSDLMRAGSLPIAFALRYLADALTGLQAAHDVGIVHRDVKPGNIMIGHDGTVKVIDFGLAKGRSLRADDGSTAEGTFLGTLQYASPEQAGTEPLTAASDIYSIGVVLYECIAGKRPFTGDSMGELIAAHTRDAPPPLTGAGARNRRLCDAVAPALGERPAGRFESAADFAAELRSIAAHLDDPSSVVEVQEHSPESTPTIDQHLDFPTHVSVSLQTRDSRPPTHGRKTGWMFAVFAACAIGAVWLATSSKLSPAVAERGHPIVPASMTQMSRAVTTLPVVVAPSAVAPAPSAKPSASVARRPPTEMSRITARPHVLAPPTPSTFDAPDPPISFTPTFRE